MLMAMMLMVVVVLFGVFHSSCTREVFDLLPSSLLPRFAGTC